MPIVECSLHGIKHNSNTTCLICDQEGRKDQRIVCAAIRNKTTGKILCGARHYDPIMCQHIKMKTDKTWQNADQGFIDQFGKYLDRGEAWIIAEKNGQIVRRCGGDDGTLFSENLY